MINFDEFQKKLNESKNQIVSQLGGQKSNENVYFVADPKTQKNKKYIADLRFIPYFEDPSKSIVSKRIYYLRNDDGSKLVLECPSSWGEPSILSYAYTFLKNSKDPVLNSLIENFKVSKRFYSLVKVLNDPQNEANNGKIYILAYGNQIKEKIERQIAGDEEEGLEPNYIFDLYEGRTFVLKAFVKGEYSDYAESTFKQTQGQYFLDGSVVKLDQDDEEQRKKVFEDLTKNTPIQQWKNLIESKKWDSEKTFRVLSWLYAIIDNEEVFKKIISQFLIKYSDKITYKIDLREFFSRLKGVGLEMSDLETEKEIKVENKKPAPEIKEKKTEISVSEYDYDEDDLESSIDDLLN